MSSHTYTQALRLFVSITAIREVYGGANCLPSTFTTLSLFDPSSSHLTYEEAEAQKGKATCLGMWQVVASLLQADCVWA